MKITYVLRFHNSVSYENNLLSYFSNSIFRHFNPSQRKIIYYTNFFVRLSLPLMMKTEPGREEKGISINR